MKLVVRADDVGYTDVYNIGAFKAIEDGIVTAADVMLDSPGTEDALRRLREMPWISVGWHTHMWCSPVLDPEQVPSLIIKETGRFRHDLHAADDVVYEEALAECRAQMSRCIKILGRAPDTGGGMSRGVFGRAINQVCEENNIVSGFMNSRFVIGDRVIEMKATDKWANRRIFAADGSSATKEHQVESVTELEKYDPAKFFTEDRGKMLELGKENIMASIWHPGYLDYFVYRLGDYGPGARYYTLSRLAEVEALSSERVKSWIKDNNVELINFRDALYNTNEYQMHLKQVGSELYVNYQ